MKRAKNVWLLVILMVGLAAVLLVQGKKQREQEPLTVTDFKLNTVVKLTIYDQKDPELLEEALKLCDTYEDMFSRTKEKSELYKLNHGTLKKDVQGYLVSQELGEIIKKGLYYSEISQGAFDITIEPVSALWNFTSEEKTIPEKALLEDKKELIDYRNVKVEKQHVLFQKEGMGIELGAIAKGYIADRIKEFLVEHGVKSGIIDLGGNVLCIGKRPDGKPFRVGIQKPFADRNETTCMVEISDCSVVSSGVYERGFEKNGTWYHHLLNPETGYPYENGLLSVTIFSKQSVDGDGLSTTCFALGLEKGMEFINSLPDTQAIFITDDGKMHYSKNFEEKIKIVKE